MLFIRLPGAQTANHFDSDVVLWLFDADDGNGPRVHARPDSNSHRMGQRLATLRNLDDASGRHFGALFVDAVGTAVFLNGTRTTINGRGKPHYELTTGVNQRIGVTYSRGTVEIHETVTVFYSEPGTVFEDTTEQTLVPGKNDVDEPITEEVPLVATPIPSWGQTPPIISPAHPRFVPAPRKLYLGRNLLRVGFVLAILAPMGQDLPAIKLPSVTLPEITLPAVHLPQVTLPQLSLPSVTLPALPTIDLEPTPARVDGPWTIHRDGTLEFVHSGAIWSGDFFVEEGVIYQMNNKPLPEVCLTYHGWLPICPEIVRHAQTPALP